ncbi:hypothetical protein MNBD_GAMMA04-1450 [hydrothermal vent metagenome]|uniref:Cytochrome c domain-containing protein n=1 Tax=hydrothermal vent metagenome TaxID=652676 RepID=A0A3B0W257_9ZZZZ
MKKIPFKTLSLSMAIFSQALIPQAVMAEPHPGKVLHDDNNCMRCHAEKPYNPTKTDSFPKLIKSIRFCNDNLGIGLFDDEIEELADYLNNTYYQHSK